MSQSRRLGAVRHAELDALSTQHFRNMFERLCRAGAATIHRQSLPTLLGSIGLVGPKAAGAAAAGASVTFEEAVARYDEAVAYCGRSMGECMEFFALLDADGDGVVSVGDLRAALCDGPGASGATTRASASAGISEAEFYYALDAARLLTGPRIATSNFDVASASRLDMLRADDDLREDDALPPTAADAPLTGSIVAGGLTVYQFLNVVLRFTL